MKTSCPLSVVLLSLVVVSCSNESDEGNGQSLSPSLSCDVAPADELGSTLGVDGLTGPSAKTTYGTLVCTYAAPSNEQAVILRMLETDADGFNAGRESFEELGIVTEDIPGLGQRAYSATDATGAAVSNTVVAWDGTHELQLTTTGSSVDALRTMVATILVRLAE
jgi:hypothetical protein